jgi:hypothetical protein
LALIQNQKDVHKNISTDPEEKPTKLVFILNYTILIAIIFLPQIRRWAVWLPKVALP